jgi:hypothetical protein
LTFFVGWYLVVLWPKGQTAVDIPYTAFLAQVQSGNVAKVRIVGDTITGSLVKPVPLPASKEETRASAPPNSKTTPPPGPAAPSTYSEFQIIFPSAIGDPNLISMLEAHKVVVDVSRPASPWSS